MSDEKRRLVSLLQASPRPSPRKLWCVRDACELPADVRVAILDVLGHEAATGGLDADVTANRLGRDLDALVAALDE